MNYDPFLGLSCHPHPAAPLFRGRRPERTGRPAGTAPGVPPRTLLGLARGLWRGGRLRGGLLLPTRAAAALAQADLAVGSVHAQHLDLDLVADLDHVFRAFDLVVGQFGDVQQALQPGLQLDEDAEVGELGDLALLDLPRLVAPGDVPLQGSLFICLRPSARCGCGIPRSTLRTTQVTLSPLLTTSDGWATLRTQLMSPTCSRPSMPSSTSTKAP